MRKFYETMGTNIEEYVLSLMSITADVFADPSIGNMINVAVVDILNLNIELDTNNFLEVTVNYTLTKKIGLSSPF